MNDEALNLSIRKFLKKVGINSQMAIEKAVREADEGGRLADDIPVKMRLTIDQLDIDVEFDDSLKTK